MRRTIEDALLALRQQVQAWAGGAPADVRVFVYPPEWEALMLARLPTWADARAGEGLGVELVDVGQEFAVQVDSAGVRTDLAKLESDAPRRALDDLGVLGQSTILELIKRPMPDGVRARILVNAGALAAFISYSAITNEFYGASTRPPGPIVIAFPGDADERSLSLLRLRADSNYRVPRI